MVKNFMWPSQVVNYLFAFCKKTWGERKKNYFIIFCFFLIKKEFNRIACFNYYNTKKIK